MALRREKRSLRRPTQCSTAVMEGPVPRRNVRRLEISELALTSDTELLISRWAKNKNTSYEIISA